MSAFNPHHPPHRQALILPDAPRSPDSKLHADKPMEVKILILGCQELLKCMRLWHHHLRVSRTSERYRWQTGRTRLPISVKAMIKCTSSDKGLVSLWLRFLMEWRRQKHQQRKFMNSDFTADAGFIFYYYSFLKPAASDCRSYNQITWKCFLI